MSRQTRLTAIAPAGMLLHHGTDLFGAASILRDDRIEESQHYPHHLPSVSFAREWQVAWDFGTYWERVCPVVITTSREILRARRGGARIAPYLDTCDHLKHRERESEERHLGSVERLSEVILSIDVDVDEAKAARDDHELREWLRHESAKPCSLLIDHGEWTASIDALLAHPMLNAIASRTKRRTAARQQAILAEAA